MKFFLKNPVSLIFRINKTLYEFYRAGFVSTAISEGSYELLSKGPAAITDIEDIERDMGSNLNQEGLKAWLDLGVAIGELKKKNGKYRIKGTLSKELLKPNNDERNIHKNPHRVAKLA